MNRSGYFALLGIFVIGAVGQVSGSGNRLAHLESQDPFYVDHTFPKLTTPQWVGQDGVDAVVILAIDDLRNSIIYEAFLRPILARLKQIDGRAPVSIFSNAVSPTDPRLQEWLGEGISLEVHTEAHPCPLLSRDDFCSALKNVYRCLDRLAAIPDNIPVAYRMPCCDSINSPSPRFYSEIFPRLSELGRYLQIDSSVVNLFTSADPDLPDELLVDADGDPRFTKYTPFPSFSTTIENYPYPYIFNRVGWEFPCALPSDWQAQNLHGANNPETVEDWKRCLDATVLKRGVMTWVFHPHGWIRSDQVVDWIDDTVNRYGDRVLFLTFREALDRINRNMLLGHPIRAEDGSDGGVRLLDLNEDDYLDVVIGKQDEKVTRIWNPASNRWTDCAFPVQLSGSPESYPEPVIRVEPAEGVEGAIVVSRSALEWDPGVRFGIVRPEGANRVILVQSRTSDNGQWMRGAWLWDPDNNIWSAHSEFWNGWAGMDPPLVFSDMGTDQGMRFRDVDGDGISEALIANPDRSMAWRWNHESHTWFISEWTLPAGARIVDDRGRDDGLRWVDLNNDGHADVMHSNATQFSAHLYMPEVLLGWNQGWTRVTLSGIRGQSDGLEIPMISRGGEWPSNGAWFRKNTLWVQNETTASMSDLVDRLSFKSILAGDLAAASTPEASLASIEIHPDFKVELVASEPMIQDPVAMDWGVDGSLWVVEMRDYPSGIDGHGQPGGVVKRLVDQDSDGRYDAATTYLDGLNFPNGIRVWKNGAWISAAPHILWTADTNHDGQADIIEKWASGFGEGNQQHRVNGFEWGLDGWLYIANGDSGGNITGQINIDPIPLHGRDLKLHPVTGALESIQGQTQFGRRRDDWGNWFGNNNPNWLWHYILPAASSAMNPHVRFRSRMHMLADDADLAMAYPVSRQPQRFNVVGAPGHVTSANSPTPYRDDWYGPAMHNSIFISEPAQGLIRRFHLEPDGLTFVATKAEEEKHKEFLASRDPWFRPTQLRMGPDGALYVADMYRQHIEHPQYIPDDVDTWTDFREGESLGRIYRIVPKNPLRPRQPIADRSSISPSDWLDALSSSNGWIRDQAHAWLLHECDPDASLRAQAAEKYLKASDSRTRIHLMWVILEWRMVNMQWIQILLTDRDPLVRSQGWQVFRSWMEKNPDITLDCPIVETWLDFADELTLFQSILALSCLEDVRYSSSPENIWAILTRRSIDQKNGMIEEALLSAAAHPRWRQLMASALAVSASDQSSGSGIRWQDWLQTGAREPSILQKDFSDMVLSFLEVSGNGASTIHTGMWRMQVALTALGKLGQSDPKRRALQESPALRHLVTQRMKESQQLIGDTTIPVSLRSTAVHVCRLSSSVLESGLEPDAVEQIILLIQPGQPVELISAIIDLVLAQGNGLGVTRIAPYWMHLVPDLRRQILDAVTVSPILAASFISELESGTIPRTQLSFYDRLTLFQTPWPDLNDRAHRLWPSPGVDDPSSPSWSDGPGDPVNGHQLFQQQCAICHKLRNEGAAVGPELDSFAARPWSHFVEALIRPGAAIDPAYQHVLVESKGGQTWSGILQDFSTSQVSLKSAGGHSVNIPGDQVENVEFLASSFMPEGFASVLGEQGLRDLWHYLKRPF